MFEKGTSCMRNVAGEVATVVVSGGSFFVRTKCVRPADPTAIRGPSETTRGARRLAESQWGRGVEQLENAFRSGGNPIGGSHL